MVRFRMLRRWFEYDNKEVDVAVERVGVWGGQTGLLS
jgi:hypothetical protein